MPRRLSLAAVTLLLGAAAAGCQAGYLLSQATGQLGVQRRAISLESPELEEKVGVGAAARLRWVRLILEHARQDLGLDPGTAYRTYVDTGSAPVSHAVTASHPLALIPMEWVFPFAGRVPYKGYFDREDAEQEARRLEGEGLEVLVLPVSAYSTLGWFDDPILSSMLRGDMADLVDVLLHETTHRTVYFPGQPSFNESLATFIARQGTASFLASHAELAASLPEYLEAGEQDRRREELLLRLRNDLDALYRSPSPEAAKAARKAEIFATASAALLALQPGGRGIPASNAFVLSIARYHELEPLLGRLSEKLGGRPADLVKYLRSLAPAQDPILAIRRELGDVPAPAPGP